MKIDLHLHSSVSDGSLPPAALVGAAKQGGLDLIALTDHDTAAGIEEAARQAAVTGVGLVPGIEISSTHGGLDLHILGYLIEPDHPALIAHAEAASRRREDRMRGMLHLLHERGIAVDFEDVRESAGPTAHALGRPHLARALVGRGHVRTVGEAFERYLGDGGPAFLPTDLLTPRAAIDLIHDAGGLAVWAHPPIPVLDREIRRFAKWGLDGVEALRPQTPGAEQLVLEAAAAELGLMITGGSDWHGSWHGRLGDFFVERVDIAAFLEAAGL